MAAAVLADIAQVGAYIASHVGMPSVDLDCMREAQVVSIVNKISALRSLDITESTSLVTAIRGTAFTADQIGMMVVAVNERLVAAGQNHNDNAQPQSFMYLQNYLPASAWAYLEGDHPPSTKQSHIIELLRALGVTNPDEGSQAHIASFLILVARHDVHTPLEKYELKTDVKNLLLPPKKKAMRTRARVVPFIAEYPEDAAKGLPPAMFAAIYPGGPPAPRQVAGLIDLEHDFPKRKTHKSLRGSPVAPAPPLLQLGGAVPANINTFLTGLYQQFMRGQSDCPITYAGGRGRPPARGAALPAPGADGDSPAGDGSIMHFRPPKRARTDFSDEFDDSPGGCADAHAVGDGAMRPPACPAPSTLACGDVMVEAKPAATHAHHAPLGDIEMGDPEKGCTRVGGMKPPMTVAASSVDALVARQRKAFAARDKAASGKGKKGKEKEVMAKPAAAIPRAKAKAAASSKAAKRSAHEPPRPKMPSTKKQSEPIIWFGGKIYISLSKEAFRVLPSVGDKVDKIFTWRVCGGANIAWAQALDFISETRHNEPFGLSFP